MKSTRFINHVVLLSCYTGGSISQDGEKPYTSACIFAASEDMDSMREQEQVSFEFVTLITFPRDCIA